MLTICVCTFFCSCCVNALHKLWIGGYYIYGYLCLLEHATKYKVLCVHYVHRLHRKCLFLTPSPPLSTFFQHLDLTGSFFLSEDESLPMTLFWSPQRAQMNGERRRPLLSLPLAAGCAEQDPGTRQGIRVQPPVGNGTTSELVYYGGVVGRVSVGVEAGHCVVFFY